MLFNGDCIQVLTVSIVRMLSTRLTLQPSFGKALIKLMKRAVPFLDRLALFMRLKPYVSPTLGARGVTCSAVEGALRKGFS